MTFEEWLKEEEKKKKKGTVETTTSTENLTFNEWLSRETGTQPTQYDDIAPVRETEKRTWFDKGAFDDGYQFGDVTKTVLGTIGDTASDLLAGVVGMAENVADAGVYLMDAAAQASAKATGYRNPYAHKFTKQTQELIEKDLINEKAVADTILLGIDKTNYEDYSVWGDKTDSLVQSGGQLLGTVGLQAVGVPWFVTTGVTSFGSGVEEAFNEGASYGEAGLSGTIQAGADILTEKLFGGSGLGEKGLINLDGLTKGISNKVVKSLVDFGVDMTAEGAEEVAASVMTNLGSSLYKEENLGDLLFSEEAVDEYIESFVGGAVLGGGMNLGKVSKSVKSGRDYRTGLTANEQKVFDKVYEDAIADAEKDGKKLTKNEKAELYDSIMDKLDKGYISTDTIEEVLGGESYTEYKEFLDIDTNRKNELEEWKKEYDALYKMKNMEKSDEQIDRQAQLKKQIEAFDPSFKSEELKTKLSNEVRSAIAKDGKLVESYNEIARKGQAFTADLTKYKGKQKEAIERAIKSGVLNNTNRSHELVDILAKIEADKGIIFDYTDNEKLKASGFAVEGKTVNGFEKNGTVTLNVQSAKSWQSVVGHEITHILEGTSAYTELRSALYAYAESKGELASRKAALTELYKDMDADIDAELTADLVGDYLFGDKKFISNLTTNKTVFQKVYDEIKYLWNVATGKEKAQIEKVKREFDRVWEEFVAEDVSETDNVKFSIREEAPPKETGIAYKVFFVKDGKLYPPMVANPDGADTPMGVWLNADVGTAAPPSKTGRAQVKAGGKGTQGGSGSLAFRPGWHLGDLPRASQFDRVNPETGKKELFPENFVWAEVEYAKDVDYQEEAMSYGYTENGKFRHAYAGLPKLPENGYYRYRTNPKPDTVPWVITGAMKVNRLLSDAEVNEILEKNGVAPVHRQGGDVDLDKFGFDKSGKVKYSVSADSEGNQLSKEQSEYFKDSKVRDENGNLKVMYHGSPNADFTVFKSGTYFTEHKWYADLYQNQGASSLGYKKTANNPDTYAVYLDIKKPFDTRNKTERDIFYNEYYRQWGTGTNLMESGLPDWLDAQDLQEFLEENGYDYDGLILDEGGVGGYGEEVTSRGLSYVVFNPEQVKNVDNKKPTTDPDIRYSVSEDTQKTDSVYLKLAENGNTEIAQKMVDDAAKNAGYDIKAYHGTGYDFTVFDKSKQGDNYQDWGRLGKGFYFAPTSREAETWAELSKGSKNKVMPVYLRSENMLDSFEALPDNLKDTIPENWDSLTRRLAEKYAYNYIEYMQEFGYNVQEILTQKGYDGINGHTEFVVFDPEQVKSADAITYDDKGNVIPLSQRFNKANEDIRFSLSKSVEETKDLIAVHNLSEEKLLKSLQLGGLPMPSIAIARAKEGHGDYGKISLVFGKDTIDPQNNRNNKVYSGDAWTPVYPRIDHKINEKVQAEIEERINGLIPENVARDLGGLHIDSYNLEQELNRNNGSIINVFRNNAALKYAFLAESGAKPELPTKNKRLAKYSNHPDDAIVRVAENVSKEKLQGILREYTTEQIYEVEPEIRKAVNEYFKEKYKKLPPNALKSLLRKDELSRGDIDDYAQEALDYLKNGIVQEIDYSAAKTLIDEAIDTQKYESWVKDVFANIVEKEGVRNNKDIFTPSGNRRSFDALHYEHNLENVIKAMRESGEKGIGTFGRGNIFGASTTEYKSIADIKDAANTRLQNMPQEEYEAIRKGFSERFFELAYSLPIHKDSFTATDSAANMLIEAIAKFKTRSGIANYLRTESKGWANYSDYVVDDLIQLVDEIRQMPTQYFEAKPQRAVGFNEVATAIIPDNASAELKQMLTDKGVDFVEYEGGNEEARLNVLNSLEEYKFSLSKQGENIAPIGNYSTPLNETYLAPTKETISNMETVEAPMPSDAPIVEEETTTLEDEKVEEVIDKDTFFSKKAYDLYEEVKGMRKGNRVSRELSYLLDTLDLTEENKNASYKSLKTALINIKNSPNKVVNEGSAIEAAARELLNNSYKKANNSISQKIAEKIEKLKVDLENSHKLKEESAADFDRRIAILEAEYEAKKNKTLETELANNIRLREESKTDFDTEIAQLQAEYEAKKNKNTKVANNILRRIERLQRFRDGADADYEKRIANLKARIDGINSPQHQIKIDRLKQRKAETDARFEEKITSLNERIQKMQTPEYNRAMHKQAKMQEHAKWAADTLGDTTTWKDKKTGFQYASNTERRNLRDIVRDENGNVDIARADAIDDALNGRYNREEANKKRELAEVRKKYADLKINSKESAYIQMLGELRGNPKTTLTEKVVNEYYEQHKNKIDKAKVEKALEYARQDYDNLIKRVNAELSKQGMKEIPYRQGYFPHFTEPKQNFIQKLLNWKTQDNEIPTSIAGLTEDFKPVKSWQSFDKTRYSDETDYDFLKGFDSYSEGALDWIHHLDTLQKRRAVENHIRFTHSDEGIQARIKEVYANEEYDADEAQAQIEHILTEAKNPLNNFVQDFTTKTNILANKKNSLDRTVEQLTNRKIYSTMTNVQNRTSANMVLANVRSALTNFIPITQSWAQVSPMRSLQAAKETIANAIKDDGTINKSTFLTNRLREVDNLYKSNWDKVLDKAGIMFEIVDNFSSQVIWRSKYNDNLAKGMSESEAIANADQFAENVMAGRSKGNEPTIFNAKNPLVKAFTMFQLEVNNQYGYFFKDVPNDLKAETEHWKFNLAKGYTTAFIGAYVYNALLEQVAGSGAALDPIGIIEDLLRDLGLFDDDEEEEPKDVVMNLIENVGGELPFVGGTLFGGGRIPISSALPYGDNGLVDGVGNLVTDVTEGNWKNVGKEMMNPVLNIGLPVGGGQLKKTVQGLKMFNTDEEHPVMGSYTDSGALRFPVEDTLGNRIQAGIFGQYANKNAREYFDNGYAPLKEKQIQEYMDVDLPIADYWKYRDGLKGLKTNDEKADFINSLDIEDWQKNLLMNNILDRKEDVDMTNYDDYGDWEEFDYAQKNPEKSALAKSVGGYSAYKTYSKDLYDIKADKDENGKSVTGSRKEKVINYINNLDADYETKIILFKSEYPSDDTYNADIINYLNNREDLTYDERVAIYTELGFIVKDGYVYWD